MLPIPIPEEVHSVVLSDRRKEKNSKTKPQQNKTTSQNRTASFRVSHTIRVQ